MENTSSLEEKQNGDVGGKRFLVALDLGLKRMEKLCTISTLCHHLKRDLVNQKDLTSFASSRTSKKIRAHLGVETHDMLVQLVECQMLLTRKTEHEEDTPRVGNEDTNDDNLVGGKVANESTSKRELVRKFHGNDAKRNFLLQIMARAKAYFGSLEKVPNPEEEGELSISIVSLLRDALKSKYKEHVRRCFRELDVESLTSILFLMRLKSSGGSGTGEHSEQLDSRPAFLSSSIEDIEESIDEQLELESYYFAQSSISQTPSSSLFFLDEEEAIESLNVVDKGSEVETRLEHTVRRQENERKDTKIQYQIMMTNESTKALATSAWVNDEITVFQDLRGYQDVDVLKWKKYDDQRKQDSETRSRILQLLYKLLTGVPPNLSTHFLTDKERNELKDLEGFQPLKNLLKHLRDLRAIAVSLMSCNGLNGNEESSSNAIMKLTITHSLLRTEEDRLKSKVDKMMVKIQQRMKALDDTLEEWTLKVKEAKNESDCAVRNYVKDQVIKCAVSKITFQSEITETEEQLKTEKNSLETTIKFVKQSTKSLRARRHYLEASLDSLIRQYDSTMLKFQAKIDELSVEEIGNGRQIDALQNRFKDIEEKYDEMRATKRLKELLKNMEKAESIKQNWAARKIQMAWRRYKVAKLRKRKLKGRKKGKKKTPPPPDKGISPAKTITSSSRSRSKSQTP